MPGLSLSFGLGLSPPYVRSSEQGVRFDGAYISRSSAVDFGGDEFLFGGVVDWAGPWAEAEVLMSFQSMNTIWYRYGNTERNAGIDGTAGQAYVLFLDGLANRGGRECFLVHCLGSTRGDHYVWQNGWMGVTDDTMQSPIDTVMSNCSLMANNFGTQLFKGVAYRVFCFGHPQNIDIRTPEIQDLFVTGSGRVVDPEASYEVLGTPLFDFYGDADFWNAARPHGTLTTGWTMNGQVTDN